ncbi:MAG: hypothetical protein ONB23_01325 [candidate division KSB1 bacterium]|nr:hypothetical protein [candidate division KSB1 bacterium]
MKKVAFLFVVAGLVAGCSKGKEEKVLARVGKVEITQEQFDAELAQVPERQRVQFERDKEAFLEELIVREVVRQEAERRFGPLEPSEVASHSDTAKTMNPAWFQRMNQLVRGVAETVSVSLEEAKNFYDEHREQMGGRTFGEIAPMIQAYLQQAKQQQAVEAYIDSLRRAAQVWRNEQVIEKWNAALENPVRDAIQKGKPVAAVFAVSGYQNTMDLWTNLQAVQPDSLAPFQKVLVDLRELGYLARKYDITQVPTLLLFDAQGKEVSRQIGVQSTEQLRAALASAGFFGTDTSKATSLP